MILMVAVENFEMAEVIAGIFMLSIWIVIILNKLNIPASIITICLGEVPAKTAVVPWIGTRLATCLRSAWS